MNHRHILVASASDELVYDLSARCRPVDLEVRWAADARQALFMVHKSLPDVVIMNQDIPVDDALSVFQLMSTDRRMRSIRMIVLASAEGQPWQSRAQELSVQYVVAGQDPWSSLEPLLCHLFQLKDTAPPAPPRCASEPKVISTCGSTLPDAPLILVIDDDVVVTRAINVRMVSKGYRVICAHNGVDAFAIAKQQQPDVMTLDVGLPHMDGLGLMQNLTSHPLTGHIPIVVLTGQKDEQLERMFLDMGAFAFMTKPFSTQDLLEQIEKAVRFFGKRQLPAKRK